MLNNKSQLRSVSETLLQPQQNQPGATVLFASTLHIVYERLFLPLGLNQVERNNTLLS